MKTSFKTLAVLLVATAFSFASCTEKENIKPVNPVTPDPPQEETVENILNGTSWTCHMENSTRVEGLLLNITYDVFIDFNDSFNGEMFHDTYYEIPAYPQYSQGSNYTQPFTYTYYGDSCLLTCSYIDIETGETFNYNYTLTHDKEANTLTIDFHDSDMRDMMGTNIAVLHPVTYATQKHRKTPLDNSIITWDGPRKMIPLMLILEALAQ